LAEHVARLGGRFLRPRRVDGHSPISFPDLIPDSTGKVPFDVDNDGDGVTDAVWLDLGYPATRDASGRLMKPLFAFTVIGLNGRIPLNTAGNLQKRGPATATDPGPPLFRHASHLGNSPSEVDPTYALGNAPGFSLVDDQSVPVALTQLRNLLAGTRPRGAGNEDANTVVVGGQTIVMPNNIADEGSARSRGTVPPVAGRWGEGQFVPTTTEPVYNNRIRAGLSRDFAYGFGGDDNFNMFDPWGSPVTSDYYDDAGGLIAPVERIRRFVTPIDVSGNGRVTTWGTASNMGPDALGPRQLPALLPAAGGPRRGRLESHARPGSDRRRRTGDRRRDQQPLSRLRVPQEPGPPPRQHPAAGGLRGDARRGAG
jgi:hypothetical protein